MDRVQIRAHAKVNLVLRVLDREPSGFHNIETIFALLDLHDLLSVERRDGGISVDVDGADTGPERQNLAYRAAQMALEATTSQFGVHIHIGKSIPVRAGLGGGSSDGAAVLHAVNMLDGESISASRLLALAAALGSDVPFFASRSAFAVGRGRGEQLTAFSGPDSASALVIQPRFGVSTGEAYGLLAASRQGSESIQRPILTEPGPSNWPGIVEVSGNDFEDVLLAKMPELHDFYTRLKNTGPLITRLCGSGSAIIGIFTSISDRDAAMTEFSDAGHVIQTSIRGVPAPEPEFD